MADPARLRRRHGIAPSRRSAEHGFTSSTRSAEHGFTSSTRSAEHGFTSSTRSAEHGFTLIEIMVALAVFSLAALALIRLESATVRGAGIVDATLAANMVARNVAIEAMTDGRPPALGVQRGTEANAGRAWRWTRTVAPTGNINVLRIDVAVQDVRGSTIGRAVMVRSNTGTPS